VASFYGTTMAVLGLFSCMIELVKEGYFLLFYCDGYRVQISIVSMG
jgi:hypothetical protein